MGNLEALLRESYKFIRLADDLHDIKGYLNDMRICFIALTVSGYVGIIIYALLLLCRRRKKRPFLPGPQPPYHASHPVYRARDPSASEWDEGRSEDDNRRPNSTALPPQSRHDPSMRRGDLSSRSMARRGISTAEGQDPEKGVLSRQSTLADRLQDRQTSPGVDSFSHVVPALIRSEHGNGEKV